MITVNTEKNIYFMSFTFEHPVEGKRKVSDNLEIDIVANVFYVYTFNFHCTKQMKGSMLTNSKDNVTCTSLTKKYYNGAWYISNLTPTYGYFPYNSFCETNEYISLFLLNHLFLDYV